MGRTDETLPEFSRVVSLKDLGKDEMRLDLVASTEECAALARRFELSAIEGLRATGGLWRLGGGRVRLRVKLRTEVSQTCVVTLDPVVNQIEEDLDILFETDTNDLATMDMSFDPTSDREPLTGDSLDVGEISYRSGSTEKFLACSGGFAEVLPDCVSILAETAETAEEIDVERAQRSRESAETLLKSQLSGQEFLRAELRLKKAIGRIRVRERTR